MADYKFISSPPSHQSLCKMNEPFTIFFKITIYKHVGLWQKVALASVGH